MLQKVMVMAKASESGNATYDVEACPAGKFSSTSSARGCEHCEQGEVQPETGKAVCEQCSAKEYVKTNTSTGKPDHKTCVPCPLFGVKCDGKERKYLGGYWHDDTIINPDDQTSMYACITDGCPNEGSTAMGCKAGYVGPLCAVCDEGHFLQLRTCTNCGGSGPSPSAVALFVFSLLVAIGLAVAVVRHRRFLASTGAFAQVKVRGLARRHWRLASLIDSYRLWSLVPLADPRLVRDRDAHGEHAIRHRLAASVFAYAGYKRSRIRDADLRWARCWVGRSPKYRISHITSQI